MRKVVGIIVITAVILIVGYFAASIVMYQRVVAEGSVIADNQCLKVNPIIIERKNAYLKSMQALKDNNADEYGKQTDKYLAASKKYVAEQTAWLETQEKYMHSWSFKNFAPQYIVNAAQYQYDSRKADTESTTFLIEAFEITLLNSSIAEELSEKSMEKIKVRNEAEKKYDEIWDNPGKLDWRTRFIRVPESKCPDENFDIPAVEDFFNHPSTDSPLS